MLRMKFEYKYYRNAYSICYTTSLVPSFFSEKLNQLF